MLAFSIRCGEMTTQGLVCRLYPTERITDYDGGMFLIVNRKRHFLFCFSVLHLYVNSTENSPYKSLSLSITHLLQETIEINNMSSNTPRLPSLEVCLACHSVDVCLVLAKHSPTVGGNCLCKILSKKSTPYSGNFKMTSM
jgi:hypothetical protein